VKSTTSYKAPYYVVFSILLLPVSWIQIFTSASYSQTPQSMFFPSSERLSSTPV